MQKYLEFASPVQPTVQRVDGIPTLERHELGANLCTNANFKDNNNNTEGSLYSGQDYGTDWKFYSPVFIGGDNVGWKQAFGFTYHLPYPPYLNTTSLVASPADWSNIPTIPRSYKMYGQGTDFSFAFNQNPDRTYEEPPIVGLTNNSTNVTSSTAWRDAGTWTKYDRQQSVATTADVVKFGAWVKCDPNDLFRQLNMGGLYLWQNTSTSPTPGGGTPAIVYVNAMVVKRASHTPNLKTGTVSTGAPNQGHYNWGGLSHLDPNIINSSTRYRWNDTLTVQGIDYYDAEDTAVWTRIEKTVTLQGTGMKQIGLATFFAENCSYLDGGSELSGSIEFYNPYVIPVSGVDATSYTISNFTITGDGGVTVNSPSTPATVTTEEVTFNVTVTSGSREIDYIEVEGLGTAAPLTMTGAGTTWTRSTSGSDVIFTAVSRPQQGTYDLTLKVVEGTTGTAVIKIEGAET
jgi:hypothetical protein